MVICPLTLDECNKAIPPLPRTAFIMAPSADKTPPVLEKVINSLISSLEQYSMSYIFGAELVDVGDFLCSICKHIQGTVLGVAVSSTDLPAGTAGNIFWEMGLMQGFGKPVILVTDDRRNLPSDFARSYSIFFNQPNYMRKFKSLLQAINGRERYYSETLADLALNSGDYEKAARYLREAYLIGKDELILGKIRVLGKSLRAERSIPDGYKKRLIDQLSVFTREVSRKRK
ncbi:MAG: hypothetical protein HYY29_00265 [Chloroflexi bacterium]|nr:hypothetical protein [Chloroflexota bacterium]